VSRTPIIVISARGREEDKVDALDAGADDYLTKPFGSTSSWHACVSLSGMPSSWLGRPNHRSSKSADYASTSA